MLIKCLWTAGIAVVVLTACSEEEKVGGPDMVPTPAVVLLAQPEVVQELDEQAAAATGGVIEIAAADIQFSPNNFTVMVGESVTIRVKNSDAISHNLRIAGLDGEYDTDDDAVTLPEAINDGESGELNFAPPVVGAYTFQCDFHPASMGSQVVAR